MALTDESSPAYLPGFFQIALGSVHDAPQWWRPPAPAPESAGTNTSPISTRAASGSSGPVTTPIWSRSGCPALDGVVAKLEAGANAADVGCGHGASTILMAQAFPASTFAGFDYHEASIEMAVVTGRGSWGR